MHIRSSDLENSSAYSVSFLSEKFIWVFSFRNSPPQSPLPPPPSLSVCLRASNSCARVSFRCPYGYLPRSHPNPQVSVASESREIEKKNNKSHTAGYIFGQTIVCIFCVSIQMEMNLIKWPQRHNVMVLTIYEPSAQANATCNEKNHVLTVGKKAVDWFGSFSFWHR